DFRRVRARICAIGEATAAAVSALKLGIDLVPDEKVAEGVVAAFDRVELEGKRVLFPRASGAREVIPASLESRGAVVDAPEAYANVLPWDADAKIASYFKKGRVPDWITFTSPSTVKNFLALAGAEKRATVKVASIGRTTSETLRKHGLSVDAEARTPSSEALVEAITRETL
ncbi:MAG: uroporphyrinogen-III synthase, partial [Bryobacteraceae bacterium]